MLRIELLNVTMKLRGIYTKDNYGDNAGVTDIITCSLLFH